MLGSDVNGGHSRASKVLWGALIVVAMLGASLATIGIGQDTAEARGPRYDSPTTQATGPAYFGPAPNPFPYCDSPTYFDPFPENVNPVGRMDVGDTASVTTDGVTMNLAITSEGNPDTQYPGFFPQGGDGEANDQAMGIALAEGDGAMITLSEPLFYSQWIFTDVDQPNDGFTVTPQWTAPGQAAVFSGDTEFTFAGSTASAVVLDDTNGTPEAAESINGRAQVDFLGSVTGIEMLRTSPSSGQSGFAAGGGCEAAGTSKALVAGPTWNGTSFDVTYELRIANNLPSSATIQSVINDAIAEGGGSYVTDAPEGIRVWYMRLRDDLRDPAFSDITVTDVSSDGPLIINQAFDGVSDFDLVSGGVVAAESTELITLSVSYTPDLASATWTECQTGYDYWNQTELVAKVANVQVSDRSDDGVNAGPGNDNGAGGVDDPTPVSFPCLSGDLEIVKTVVPGPGGECPAFIDGVPGDGTPLEVTADDIVTFCVSVYNPGTGPITNVTATDAQAPSILEFDDLAPGETDTTSYDLQVSLSTPPQNTATATANDARGPVGPVSDTALININPKPQPTLEIVKTVVPGPGGDCPATFAEGTPGDGDALAVAYGDEVTYCITVRNTGGSPATEVVITDPAVDAPIAVGTLAVDAEASRSYDVTVTADTDLVNTATATGQGPNGPVGPVSDTAVIAPGDPVLEIVKTVLAGADAACPSFDGGVVGEGDPLAVEYSDTVTYCVTVRNTGASDATNVVITDPQAPTSYAIDTLAAGDERTFSYPVTVTADTPERNVATANGQGPNGALDPVSDPAVIDPSPQPEPALEIVKTVVLGPNGFCPSFADGVQGPGDPLQVVQGQTVTYCVSILNSGLGDADNVMVSDDQAPQSPFTIGSLPAGEGRTIQYDLEVTDTIGLRNVATVTGNGPTGPVPPADDDALISTSSANISLIHSVAKADDECLTVAKNLNSMVADVEDLPITWCTQITNNGSVPLTNVMLATPDIADGDPVNVLAASDSTVLLPGESMYLPVAGTIPDGGLVSNARVTADPSDEAGNVLPGATKPTDSDDAVVHEASINIETTVAIGADADCADAVEVVLVPEGADITWCFEVTNTGATDLLVPEVTEPTLGITVPIPAEDQQMAPNEPVVVSVNDVAEGDVVADASVRGKPVDAEGVIIDDAPEVTDEDPAEVIIPRSDLAIDKTVSDRGPVPVGEELTYTLVITNNGPHRAENVVVDDQLPAGMRYVALPAQDGWACALTADQTGFSCLRAGEFEAGASETLTYTAVITDAAPKETDLVNKASVTSDTPDDDPTNNDDTEITETPEPEVVVPRPQQPEPPEQPEYPGPFTPAEPETPSAETPPDEVLGLAITGASSDWLAMIAALMIALGGVFIVGARRSMSDDE